MAVEAPMSDTRIPMLKPERNRDNPRTKARRPRTTTEALAQPQRNVTGALAIAITAFYFFAAEDR